MVILLKIKGRDIFSIRPYYYFGVTHCENSEVQMVVFAKIKHATGMETCTKVTKVYVLFIFILV